MWITQQFSFAFLPSTLTMPPARNNSQNHCQFGPVPRVVGYNAALSPNDPEVWTRLSPTLVIVSLMGTTHILLLMKLVLWSKPYQIQKHFKNLKTSCISHTHFALCSHMIFIDQKDNHWEDLGFVQRKFWILRNRSPNLIPNPSPPILMITSSLILIRRITKIDERFILRTPPFIQIHTIWMSTMSQPLLMTPTKSFRKGLISWF